MEFNNHLVVYLVIDIFLTFLFLKIDYITLIVRNIPIYFIHFQSIKQ